jgi:hypothetical protein
MAHGQGGDTIRVRLLWRRYQGRKSQQQLKVRKRDLEDALDLKNVITQTCPDVADCVL